VNRMELLLNAKKFKCMPASIRLAAMYYRWVMFDLLASGDRKTYNSTRHFRCWLKESIRSSGLTIASLPQVSQKNFLGVWFKCDREMDIASLKAMTHEFYDIKKRYNGFTAIEITASE